MLQYPPQIRKSKQEDEKLLSQWLSNQQDCNMAIGYFPYTKGDFLKWSTSEDQFGWILEIDGKPVGYGEIWIDEASQDAELAHIIISPDVRGMGYGKTITNLLFHKACEYGYPWVYMRVFPDNASAIKCYQSVGFDFLKDIIPEMESKWIWLRRASI